MASAGSWVDTYAGNANGATSNENVIVGVTNANATVTTEHGNVEHWVTGLGYDGMRVAIRDSVAELDQADSGVNANLIDYSAV